MKNTEETDKNIQGITIKVILELKNPEDAEKIRKTMRAYTNACSFISEYIFQNKFIMNPITLQEKIYKTLRTEYGLKSMMAQSSIRHVIAKYKAVKTQLNQKPFRYKDENGEWMRIHKTLEWLWKPIHFVSQQVILVRGRDWSKTSKGELSINTLDGRIKMIPTCHKVFDKYLDGTWKLGNAILFEKDGKWRFHITATKEIPEKTREDFHKVVGIDRGLRFIANTYDEKGEVMFFSGKEARRKRENFDKVREELQKRGTRSARKKLKKISGRENRWMTDVNHCISKTLVQEFGEDTLFVLEDLVDISHHPVKAKTEKGRKWNHSVSSWAFYQLEQFLSYKANLNNSMVLKVSAKYTSQRCPKCGSVDSSNRHHSIHEYICKNCGYHSNDDRVAAMNIQMLGTRWMTGEDYPFYTKI